MSSIPSPDLTFSPAASAQIAPSLGVSLGVFRLPTDPLFHAALTLRNAVVGSRYRITRSDTGAELATGIVASATEVIPGLPCYANPQLVGMAIRKGTTAPKYLPYDAQTEIPKSGGVAFVAQVADPIA